MPSDHSGALERVLSLLATPPAAPDTRDGYLDLLPPESTGRRSLAQALMLSTPVPAVYERWWRPALGQLAKGVFGPTMRGERDIALDYLDLAPGDTVLDIACGPGNFTREFARAVGERGLAIGLDVSPTMLRRAVTDTDADTVGYLRADAADLPFADASLDAVCCFAALHLFDEPWTALDRIAVVVKPGGRLALMTTCARGPSPVRGVSGALAGATGIRMFGVAELADALAARGFAEVRQRLDGVVQFVGAVRRR
ncbi:MAG: methyltransferase domain-containing protein [Micromonosporaceae bacterium]|nr:methyltransferase domain-containing protein [Micromonosporaceae bacterium]